MKPTLPERGLRRNTGSPQVVEIKRPSKPKAVLSVTALEIAYRWLFRRQAQAYLASKYGLSRPVVEAIIRDVLAGEHGPFVAPSARVERMAA